MRSGGDCDSRPGPLREYTGPKLSCLKATFARRCCRQCTRIISSSSAYFDLLITLLATCYLSRVLTTTLLMPFIDITNEFKRKVEDLTQSSSLAAQSSKRSRQVDLIRARERGKAAEDNFLTEAYSIVRHFVLMLVVG